MAGISGRKVMFIVLLLAAGLLSLFIFAQSTQVYEGSQETVARRGDVTECTGKLYGLRNMEYEGGTLSFTLRYERYSDATSISSVTINNQTLPAALYKGQEQRMATDIEIGDNFTAYVDECSAFKVVCTLSHERCI